MKTTPPSPVPEVPRAVGRPSGYSPEMVAHLCSFVRHWGYSDSAAALQAGLSTSTLSRWKQDYPELTLALLQAKQEFRMAQMDIVLAAAKGKNGWRAAAWLLQHIFPEDYAPRADQRTAFQKQAIAAGALEPKIDPVMQAARKFDFFKPSRSEETDLDNSRNSPAAPISPVASQPGRPLAGPLVPPAVIS